MIEQVDDGSSHKKNWLSVQHLKSISWGNLSGICSLEQHD